MAFPIQRSRRLRQNPTLRAMMRENHVAPTDLIAPLFVQNGEDIREPIASLPGQNRFSPDTAAREALELWNLGIPAVILFGIPDSKDAIGTSANDPNGPVPRAIGKIKEIAPQMCVIADVCACEYTDHGHCGILHGETVDNDSTLELLGRVAVAYAHAGCDMVAPSDMMDGRVAAIRAALDGASHAMTPIM
ncbi:MAG: porphobilinogen synthase, partial [Armatimonadetes bacterium]|nr:porphobilinogen synthase [Armatimonadota bacterium]